MTVAKVITESIEKMLVEEGRKPGAPRTHIYASGYRDCARRMYLETLYADKLGEFDVDTLARFRRGRDRERDIILLLAESGRYGGFSVERTQEYVVLKHRRTAQPVITGRCDGFIHTQSGEKYPFEVKAWTPQISERVHCFEDILNNKWTRSSAHQILTYLYGTESPIGILVIDGLALPKLITVNLFDYLEQMENFVRTAEAIVDHINEGTEPPYTDNAELCRECPLFGGLCNPPTISYGEGLKIVTDEAIISQIERWQQLKPVVEEFEELDKVIKEQFRGCESAIAGRFAIQGKWSSITTYNIPKEIKEQYKVTNEKGRFTLTIKEIKRYDS